MVAFVGCFVLCGVWGYACDLCVVVCCFYVGVLVRLVCGWVFFGCIVAFGLCLW